MSLRRLYDELPREGQYTIFWERAERRGYRTQVRAVLPAEGEPHLEYVQIGPRGGVTPLASGGLTSMREIASSGMEGWRAVLDAVQTVHEELSR